MTSCARGTSVGSGRKTGQMSGAVGMLTMSCLQAPEVLVVFAYAATLESVAIVDLFPRAHAAAAHGLCRHSGPDSRVFRSRRSRGP